MAWPNPIIIKPSKSGYLDKYNSVDFSQLIFICLTSNLDSRFGTANTLHFLNNEHHYYVNSGKFLLCFFQLLHLVWATSGLESATIESDRLALLDFKRGVVCIFSSA